MSHMSELAYYHATNPDPLGVAGCLNTGNDEDGVVFPGVEVLEVSDCYIGRTSIIEAVALLYDTTPDRVKALLTGNKATAQKVRELETKLTEYTLRNDEGLKLVELAAEALR